MTDTAPSFDTLLARGGALAADPYHATSPPLYQTATFAQEEPARFGEFDYTRTDNPTRRALEGQLAALEGATGALTYSSGMAAVAACARLVRPGERLLAGADLYGGTQRFLHGLRDQGVTVEQLDDHSVEGLQRALAPRAGAAPARLVWLESPSNPLLDIVDLRGAARACSAAGALLAVDGTATSPALQRPLALGAHLVVHSATKLLAGHGDVTAGVVAAHDAQLLEELAARRNAEGTALAPFEAWLLQRGLRTLGLRIERQQRTALALAERLSALPSVARVRFPGLADHPGAGVHAGQASGPGQLLSFELREPARARGVVAATRLFSTAVSFGGLASSISLPACMSHASVPRERKARAPLPAGLVRVSVGIEGVEDLWRDLEHALQAPETTQVARGAAMERPAAVGWVAP
ncbi:MAG: PLP-dependent aspartate aminotransferase family protein [Planctomycetota bacterium]